MNKSLKLGSQLLRRLSSTGTNVRYLLQPKQRGVLNKNLNNLGKQLVVDALQLSQLIFAMQNVFFVRTNFKLGRCK